VEVHKHPYVHTHTYPVPSTHTITLITMYYIYCSQGPSHLARPCLCPSHLLNITTISTDAVTVGNIIGYGTCVTYAFIIPGSFAAGFIIAIHPSRDADEDLILFDTRPDTTTCTTMASCTTFNSYNCSGIVAYADVSASGMAASMTVSPSNYVGTGQVSASTYTFYC
jgi:hypothetical protein